MSYKSYLLFLFVPLFISITTGCSGDGTESAEVQKKAINTILDDWHLAASEGNFDRYFSHFESDSSIFMGTDATERWTVYEFKPWAEPHFDGEQAWDFTPVNRYVYLSDDGDTAWFDESLDTPNLGPVRGSGVLVQKEETWKITHYNLSIPIPNAIVDTVVTQVEDALEDSLSE
ncbi:MAG: nuclear transport factor 2 family protein [Bacteroidota bacterium]